MSSCHSQIPELTPNEVAFKSDREKQITEEIRGLLRVTVLPLAMMSPTDLFAPIDQVLGIDRRYILKKELLSLIGLLDLKLEDTYGTDQGEGDEPLCDDRGGTQED